MAATNSHSFEWGIDRAVVHAGICLGPKSINSWYKQRHSVCVNVVVGGGRGVLLIGSQTAREPVTVVLHILLW